MTGNDTMTKHEPNRVCSTWQLTTTLTLRIRHAAITVTDLMTENHRFYNNLVGFTGCAGQRINLKSVWQSAKNSLLGWSSGHRKYEIGPADQPRMHRWRKCFNRRQRVH